MKKINNDLKSILKSITYINDIMSYIEGYSYESYNNDPKTIDASLMKLTQIGEMVGRITKKFQDIHNDINWREIKGLRNVVVHNYESVNEMIIWETITNNLPELKETYIILLNQYIVEKIDYNNNDCIKSLINESSSES